jgi:hypothetical protein
MTRAITVQISAGELIDKLTILELRLDRISDPDKRANVVTEHALLLATYEASIPESQHALALKTKLREVNEALWDIENEIRDCERRGDFGPRFVDLARLVYKTNDRRSEIKREINVLLHSQLVDEKSYTQY